MRLALALSLLGLAACRVPPDERRDASAAHDASGDGGPRTTVLFDRSFGAEGEQPRALLLGAEGELVAVSDRALYRLDPDGRVLSRTALEPQPLAAAWDGAGPGVLLRRVGAAGGIVLALHDAVGAPAGAPLPVAGPEAEARLAFDGQLHRIVWGASAASGLELRLSSFARVGSGEPTRVLASGLAPTSALGELAVPAPASLALCTLEPGGTAQLRRFPTASNAPAEAPLSVGEPGRVATGSCQLAASDRALLVATRTRALAPAAVDLGPRTTDLALGALAFDVPVARAVRAGVAGETLRLTLQPGTVRLEALLFDGARFVALTLAAGIAGGRLLLTLLDDEGRLVARDLPLPLDYEPGSLSTARLVARPLAGDYFLCYGSRRPWDEGILHLVRFRLVP
jgi:hypothetical protein